MWNLLSNSSILATAVAIRLLFDIIPLPLHSTAEGIEAKYPPLLDTFRRKLTLPLASHHARSGRPQQHNNFAVSGVQFPAQLQSRLQHFLVQGQGMLLVIAL